jgi:hypothetical protein
VRELASGNTPSNRTIRSRLGDEACTRDELIANGGRNGKSTVTGWDARSGPPRSARSVPDQATPLAPSPDARRPTPPVDLPPHADEDSSKPDE